MRFDFAFDRLARVLLALAGIRGTNSWVEIDDEVFTARFGFFRLSTPTSNLRDACVTGPYWWIKAIGPRGSMVDHGATFGTNARSGCCVRFHEPVGALLGPNRFRHPGLTVTVEDPEALTEAVRRLTGSPREGSC